MATSRAEILRKRLWLNHANRKKPEVALELSPILGIPPDDIIFCDEERTDLAAQLGRAGESRTPPVQEVSRQEAIELVKTRFHTLRLPVAFLHRRQSECGAIDIELSTLLAHLDLLLQHENETFVFTSWDGRTGGYILSQEGNSPTFPRCVQTWWDGWP